MNSTLNIRIDKKLKENAGKTLKNMGLDISSGIKMFLCQVVNTKSIPFEPKMHYTMTPEQEKWVRRQIADAKKNSKGYKNGKDLFDDILED
jgi:addiction module RelB/DinJ family antitoxin